ncbi:MULTISPECIES: DUF3147 family protein [unclassified Hyphomicrobium]|uniref:DUF3147 family protein n=1 Tax=unclassified Hyphomicrobium TaxID=2619925 RepID=UPI000213F4B9|nr:MULTISPECIES: DUF3147 family protein [unclassified Hyphomicrobium]CCB67343.1 conserved membrane protein of unknown function [Hyphomicrobium sp. MC1]
MLYTALKVFLTAGLVVAISEIAKRSTVFGGIVASLPLTSLLAFIWLYGETGDTAKIASLSTSIFWYVLPSLVLFLALPILLGHGLNFWLSLAIASALTFAAYLVMTAALARFGVTL